MLYIFVIFLKILFHPVSCLLTVTMEGAMSLFKCSVERERGRLSKKICPSCREYVVTSSYSPPGRARGPATNAEPRLFFLGFTESRLFLHFVLHFRLYCIIVILTTSVIRPNIRGTPLQ